MAVISLITDFGLSDEYAGVVKGVILSKAPGVSIVDISHFIAPQNIAGAAFMLSSSYKYFSLGTVHTVIVDPGVGSNRKIIAARGGGYIFLETDNGELQGEVVHVDHYGNLVTNIEQRLLNTKFKGKNIAVTYKKMVFEISDIYKSVDKGDPLALLGSRGAIEIAVNCGNAQKSYSGLIGDKIVVSCFL